MHFVCSAFGSSGDVFPVLGLALELRARGHGITFVASRHFEPIIKQYGLSFEGLGSAEDYQAAISNPDLWEPRKAFPHVFRSLQPGLRRQYEIQAELAALGPVVGLTNCFGLGALLAQEKLGIPVITLHLQPAVLWSDYDPPALPGLFGPRWLKGLLYRLAERLVLDPVVLPTLNPWRKELGLPPIKRIAKWWHSPFGVLCMFPDWFARPQVDWPLNLMQTDFPLWNHQSQEPLAANVESFLRAGSAPIVFTPGTANLHGQRFFEAALQTCQTLRRRGIFLTPFQEQVPAKLPDSIAHFSYVPLDLLLPRSAAFVHHGGIGSMSQAMLAGIPQVLMPLAHDQFDNGARVFKLGVGGFIPAPRFTGQRLTVALSPLLTSAAVAQSCRELAQRLTSRNGLQKSADAILKRVVSQHKGERGG